MSAVSFHSFFSPSFRKTLLSHHLLETTLAKQHANGKINRLHVKSSTFSQTVFIDQPLDQSVVKYLIQKCGSIIMPHRTQRYHRKHNFLHFSIKIKFIHRTLISSDEFMDLQPRTEQLHLFSTYICPCSQKTQTSTQEFSSNCGHIPIKNKVIYCLCILKGWKHFDIHFRVCIIAYKLFI